MNELESKEYSFASIMEGTRFIVPEYQRYYSWERNHFTDLWKDLMNLLADERDTDHTHYMGTIICKHDKKLKHGDLHQYELVDGQQRLATLTILLNCIIKQAEKSEVNIPAEELSEQYIRDKVDLQEGSLNDNRVFQEVLNSKEDITADAPSQEKLVTARDFFRQKIIEETRDREQENFLTQLIEQITSLKFMVYDIETDEKATLIFESINDRGKGLTKLEKTKSFLMHRTYLCTAEEEKRTERINTIRSDFATVYTCLEKINNTSLIDKVDEDSIQSYQFVSYMTGELLKRYSDGLSREESAEKYFSILKKSFEQVDDDEEWKRIREYSADLAGFFSTYQKLVDGELPVEADTREKILAGEASYFIPLLVQAHRSTDNSEALEELIEVIDAAVFRIHHSNKRVDRGQNSFYNLAHDLHRGEKDIDQVIDGIKDTARLQ